MSISNIKAILDNPASVEYYLRMHLGRLKQDMENLSQNVAQICNNLEKLPVNPNFDSIYRICSNTDSIPTPNIPLYDGKLVNHFLWRTFWQNEELSEYQQYLWDKINRLTNTREKNAHYAKVYDYLCLQDQKKIHTILDGYIDLESFGHAELESMNTIFKY